jgi:hypothetical protein
VNLTSRWRALPYSAGADLLASACAGPKAVEGLSVAKASFGSPLPKHRCFYSRVLLQSPRFQMTNDCKHVPLGAPASWGHRSGGAGRGALSEVRHDLAGKASEALAAPGAAA